MKVTLYNVSDNTRVNAGGNPADYTFTAEVAGGTANNGTFSGISISVTEEPATFYVTTMKRLAQSNGNITLNGIQISSDPYTTKGNVITWTDVNQIGTAIYTNTRETYDVTVKKVLHSYSDKETKRFDFAASYTDTLADNSTIKKTLQGFYITTGTTEDSYKIEGIPGGATLTVTEAVDEKDRYATAYTIDGTSTDGKTASFAVTKNTTVTFDNTLKSFPVMFKLVDQDGQPLTAMFGLTRSDGTKRENLLSNNSDGVFLHQDSQFWADTYTLRQITTPGDNYLTLVGTDVTLDFVVDTFVSNHEWVTVEGDTTDGFTITVKNWEQKVVTVEKKLNDVLYTDSTFRPTFGFRYSYDVNGRTETDTFTLTPTANGTKDSYELHIPKGATNLMITELDSDTYAQITEPYDTTVESTGLSATGSSTDSVNIMILSKGRV